VIDQGAITHHPLSILYPMINIPYLNLEKVGNVHVSRAGAGCSVAACVARRRRLCTVILVCFETCERREGAAGGGGELPRLLPSALLPTGFA